MIIKANAIGFLVATAFLGKASAKNDQFIRGNGNGNGQANNKKKLFLAEKGGVVPDQFIVILDDDTEDVPGKAKGLTKKYGGKERKANYKKLIKGFAVNMNEAQAEKMSQDAGVRYVEQDHVVKKSAVTWGLDRIDEADLPLDGAYDSGYGLEGYGAAVYVIDTGVTPTHVEFGDRAISGADFVESDGTIRDDCDGHGTHVAGTAAGATYGVAPRADVIGIRVLNCQGTGYASDVIDGMEWVAAQCTGGTNSEGKKCVANMSLGGGYSQAENEVVANMRDAGIIIAVAAGNDEDDACRYSPASAAKALSVGSTTSSDARSSWSNYGTCVDLFAPGSGIASAWYTSNTATNTISGTSMASPHVAGVAALISAQYPDWTADQVEARLLGDAMPNKIFDAREGSPNLPTHVRHVRERPARRQRGLRWK